MVRGDNFNELNDFKRVEAYEVTRGRLCFQSMTVCEL